MRAGVFTDALFAGDFCAPLLAVLRVVGLLDRDALADDDVDFFRVLDVLLVEAVRALGVGFVVFLTAIFSPREK